MITHRLRLPARLDGQFAKGLIECARDLVQQSEAVVDASAVRFAGPFGVVTLGAALLRRELAGLSRPSYIAPEDSEAERFLEEVGFREMVEHGRVQDAGTLRMKRLSASSLDPWTSPKSMDRVLDS